MAQPNPTLSREVVAHHLSLFGVRCENAAGPLVLDRPGLADAGLSRRAMAGGRSVVALLPREDFLATFELAVSESAETRGADAAPIVLTAAVAGRLPWSRLRSPHKVRSFTSRDGAVLDVVVTTVDGRIVWGWQSRLPVCRCRAASAMASIAIVIGLD